MTRPHDSAAAEDPSIVPGFEPELPLPRTAGGALDPAFDPDRFDPAAQAAAGPSGWLDPALDPDRYDAGRRRDPLGQTLPELLGDGAFEEPRDTWSWALGLLGVLLFLALVSWFFGSVVTQ